MKKLLLNGLIGVVLSSASVLLAEERDSTVNVYGVGAKTDKDENSSTGMGLMFDSEDVKVKVEGTSDFIKMGAVYKYNPYDGKWYMKLGGNFINQKMYAPDNTNTRVNQYSLAMASGYMLDDDLYIELGGSYTDLNGKVFGDYEVKDEQTSAIYLELAKRFETSFGTVDATANVGEVFHDYTSDEFSYGFGLDYYPTNNSKIGYGYQNEEDNILSSYSAQYSYFFIEYLDNLSSDTYQANVGVKIAFGDLLDVSTWKAPSNIKPHLSELHKFENITFSTNMNVQSNDGVQKTQEAIDRDATPTISITLQPMETIQAPSLPNVAADAVYAFESTVPNGLTIDSTTGAISWSGESDPGTVSVTVRVTNPGGATQSTTGVFLLLSAP